MITLPARRSSAHIHETALESFVVCWATKLPQATVIQTHESQQPRAVWSSECKANSLWSVVSSSDNALRSASWQTHKRIVILGNVRQMVQRTNQPRSGF